MADAPGRIIAGSNGEADMPTTTVDGTRVFVRHYTPPLPPRLDVLMSRLFGLTLSRDLRPLGARLACTQIQMHDLATLRVGRLLCTDGIIRDVKVEMCRYCGAACVRDISFDSLGLAIVAAGAPPARRGPVRRDHILGWYSGARPGQREYR